jgi:hypothetical protein
MEISGLPLSGQISGVCPRDHRLNAKTEVHAIHCGASGGRSGNLSEVWRVVDLDSCVFWLDLGHVADGTIKTAGAHRGYLGWPLVSTQAARVLDAKQRLSVNMGGRMRMRCY